MKQIKLLIVDDHKVFLDSMGNSLAGLEDFEVVGRAASGGKALKLAKTLKPDLVLMDVSMPDMSGIEATRQLLAMLPGTRVVALTMHSARPYVLGMLNAGAAGYLLKTASLDEVARALRIIDSGTNFLSPEITHMVVAYAKDRDWAMDDPLSLLSAREREVIKFIADGHTSKTISGRMGISAKTVDVHRNNLKKKLNISTIAGLTKFAIKNGLTDLSEIE